MSCLDRWTNAKIKHDFAQLSDALDGVDISSIDCFDISHHMGESTQASCVVFNSDKGADKKSYRRFNIKNVKGGDDYEAMRQVLKRRFTKVLKDESPIADIILIDGGKGQVHAAEEILTELGITDSVLLGITKGEDRKADNDRIYSQNLNAFIDFSKADDALKLLQQARDEAHRFAISGHRQKHRKKQMTSVLELISGVGPKRRQALLEFFGGLSGIKVASIEDLSKAPGMSKASAKLVFDFFHK